MYARLRQKFAIAGTTTAVTTPTALGSTAGSLLMKDLARLMTGAITSTAGLNSEIWDIPNCEIVNNVAAGWSEYQTTYTTTSTNIPPNTSNSVIYLRTLSANNTYKYTGIGWSHTGSYWRMMYPFGVTDHVGNPTLTYWDASSGATAGGPCVFETTGKLHEHILYVTPRCIFWSVTVTAATQPFLVQTFLEYPSTALSTVYNHPNQIIWALFNTPTGTTTGTGASFNASAFNIVGGYTTAGAPISHTATNSNLGLVYTHYDNAPTGGFNSLWSTSGGGADTSTLKPTTYGSMSNTVDSSGNLISVPAMPLLHFPSWDTVYDMSSLTGVYATRSGLGATADTLTVNGQNYVYINATTMGYLIPRQ